MTRLHLAGYGGALMIALLCFGCAAGGDMQQMQENESTLRTMIANDRQQIDALQEKVARQNDQLTELAHNGGGGGDLKDLQDRITKLETQVAALQNSVQPAPAGVPASPEGGGAGVPPIAPAAVASPLPQPPAGKAPTWQEAANQELASAQNDPGAKLYRTGLTDMKAGKYQSSLTKFQEMQRKYPKSSLSGPAEFFSGNALFELGQYEKSILQFNDLVSRFPDGKYTTAALLREAQAFMKINDQIDARLTLQKLINDHPNAPEAPEAKSLMSLSS
jgi:tol-pal system protein YbgF